MLEYKAVVEYLVHLSVSTLTSCTSQTSEPNQQIFLANCSLDCAIRMFDDNTAYYPSKGVQ